MIFLLALISSVAHPCIIQAFDETLAVWCDLHAAEDIIDETKLKLVFEDQDIFASAK